MSPIINVIPVDGGTHTSKPLPPAAGGTQPQYPYDGPPIYLSQSGTLSTNDGTITSAPITMHKGDVLLMAVVGNLTGGVGGSIMEVYDLSFAGQVLAGAHFGQIFALSFNAGTLFQLHGNYYLEETNVRTGTIRFQALTNAPSPGPDPAPVTARAVIHWVIFSATDTTYPFASQPSFNNGVPNPSARPGIVLAFSGGDGGNFNLGSPSVLRDDSQFTYASQNHNITVEFWAAVSRRDIRDVAVNHQDYSNLSNFPDTVVPGATGHYEHIIDDSNFFSQTASLTLACSYSDAMVQSQLFYPQGVTSQSSVCWQMFGVELEAKPSVPQLPFHVADRGFSFTGEVSLPIRWSPGDLVSVCMVAGDPNNNIELMVGTHNADTDLRLFTKDALRLGDFQSPPLPPVPVGGHPYATVYVYEFYATTSMVGGTIHFKVFGDDRTTIQQIPCAMHYVAFSGIIENPGHYPWGAAAETGPHNPPGRQVVAPTTPLAPVVGGVPAANPFVAQWRVAVSLGALQTEYDSMMSGYPSGGQIVTGGGTVFDPSIGPQIYVDAASTFYQRYFDRANNGGGLDIAFTYQGVNATQSFLTGGPSTGGPCNWFVSTLLAPGRPGVVARLKAKLAGLTVAVQPANDLIAIDGGSHKAVPLAS